MRVYRTLRIQEVLDWDIVAAIRVDRGVSEDVLSWTAEGLLGVFVAQSFHVVANVGSALDLGSASVRLHTSSWRTYQLLSQRDLLELHAMHASIGSTEQRSCCDDEAALHRHDHFLLTKGGKDYD